MSAFPWIGTYRGPLDVLRVEVLGWTLMFPRDDEVRVADDMQRQLEGLDAPIEWRRVP